MRRAHALTLAVLTLLALGGVAQASWSHPGSASASASTATLDQPGNAHCTSPILQAGPITFTWTKPAALTGKSTGPLTYTIERRANAGAWSSLATGITATTYSDNPSALLSLGTVWQYRVTALYGTWTSPVSATVSGYYGLLSLLTVLISCT